jgi:hypothetical protein
MQQSFDTPNILVYHCTKILRRNPYMVVIEMSS